MCTMTYHEVHKFLGQPEDRHGQIRHDKTRLTATRRLVTLTADSDEPPMAVDF